MIAPGQVADAPVPGSRTDGQYLSSWLPTSARTVRQNTQCGGQVSHDINQQGLVCGDATCRQGREDIAHVRDGRTGQQALQIILSHGQQVTADHREQGKRPPGFHTARAWVRPPMQTPGA